jgi:GntR family transcriptional regulator
MGRGASTETADGSPVRTSPLYLWVASLLRARIEAGELGPGAVVPSERALSEQLNVSRMTARHALETLMLEGYVSRDARRRTLVAEPRLRFGVGSFTAIMAAEDNVPGCEVLSASTLDPDPHISEMLELAPGSRVYFVQRLRTANGEPIAIENIHVSEQRFPGLLEEDLTGSLWGILRSRYDVSATNADASVLAVALDRFEADTLKSKAGSPAIALTRIVYDAQGEVIELARDVYRGDRTEFCVTALVDSVPSASRRAHAPVLLLPGS